MYKKILFLDIDGVMNTKDTMRSVTQYQIMNPDNVRHLRNVVTSCDMQLVISSSWRNTGDWRDVVVDAFEAAGWPDPPVVDRTNVSGFNVKRGQEIHEWLKEHDFEDYLIVDDHDDIFLPIQKKRVILCDPEVGFSEREVALIKKYWKC